MNSEELKLYFEKHYKDLPMTLSGPYSFYPNLKQTVKLYLSDYENQEHLLRKILVLLKNKSNWNVKAPAFSHFNNRPSEHKQVNHATDSNPASDLLRKSGLHVNDKDQSIAVPYGYKWNPQTQRALKKLHGMGYLSTRSTIPNETS